MISGLHTVPNLVGEIKKAPIRIIIAHPHIEIIVQKRPFFQNDIKNTTIAQINNGMASQKPIMKRKKP
jgi:hypothetical protein